VNVTVSASDAPGALESVRALMNTWHVPHELRRPVDDLAIDRRSRLGVWADRMPAIPEPGVDELADLVQLRDTLRAELDRPSPIGLRSWLERFPSRVDIPDAGEAIRIIPVDDCCVARTLAIVVRAIAVGEWMRLKACPDCRHVFFDHSRNRSRTWCSMNAGGPDGRACGSISKVNAYRARQRDR
jgi:hypothetical protein